MNWRFETWRKLYVREEGSFGALTFIPRALAAMLLKICDDKGRIYARRGEEVVESICCRLGATRGERRLVRPALAELLKDGYLVAGEGHVRIRNFARAHGGGVDLEAATTAAPTGHEPVTTEPRSSDEPVTTEPRPCNEDRVNPAESFQTDADVPSVPSVPDLAFQKEERDTPPESGPLDPRPAQAEPAAVGGPDPRHLRQRSPAPPGPIWGAQRIIDAFKRARSAVFPESLDWHVAGKGLWEKASQLAGEIENDPEAQADVEPTARRYLLRVKDSQDPRDGKVSWVFACWVTEFTDLRQELRGLNRPAASGNKECDFHAGGRNSGRRAAKHEFRKACPECRHLDARAGPRPASQAQTAADLLGGTNAGG